jgi:hypothetical protein
LGLKDIGKRNVVWLGVQANKDKLTSDQRQQGCQACAMRQGPCQSSSSSVVGQGWKRPGSEHWRSCSRLRQWTWRDRWRAGELRGRVGNCGCGSRSDRRGRKGRPSCKVRAAQDTQCSAECCYNVQRDCQKIARRRMAGCIGGCAKSSQTSASVLPRSGSAS